MHVKKKYISLLSACIVSAPLFICDSAVAESTTVASMDVVREDPSLDGQITVLQSTWARIKYQTPGEDQQIEEFEALEAQGERLISSYPDKAEPRIWQGIILSTHAGVSGGFSALSRVKKARALFEQAIEIDKNALGGSAYTSLGSLYYQVPGWPLAFGSDKKAEAHLKQALSVNPDGIDPNYFYGDFLYQADRYDEAALVLQTALQAPARADRPLADAGRRQEIQVVLAKVRNKLKN